MIYDFIVIGAGPIGSYLTTLLSKDNNSVAIFDMKEKVGEDVICSGIIGSKPYSEFNLPENAVIGEISSLKFLSPSLIDFEYSSDSPFAYITDREKLDRELFNRALEAGAKPFLNSIVIDIVNNKDSISLKYLNSGDVCEESAKCIIISTGSNFSLHRKANLIPPERILWGSRGEFKQKVSDSLEVYLLNNPDIGSFGWVIPLGDKTRIGAVSEGYDRNAIYTLIQKNDKRFKTEGLKIEGAPIACGESKKMVSDRIISVGEAAGQVKTTTGGGIHYGLIGARIGYNVLKKALVSDDFSSNFLLEYERRWRIEMGEQIKSGILLRNLLSKIPVKALDMTFKYLKRESALKDRICNNFCFDYHKDIIDVGVELLFGRSILRSPRSPSTFTRKN